MQHRNDHLLHLLTARDGFEAIPCEFIRVRSSEALPTRLDTYCEATLVAHHGSPSIERLEAFCATPADVTQPNDGGSLLCLLHRSRPKHTSGEPDKLPFSDAHTTRSLFALLDLPTAYLEVAAGSLSLVHSSVIRDRQDQPERFEFLAYCVTKQGDWSMALSHCRATMETSAFWSLDQRVPSGILVEQMQHLQDFTCHPMLLPCIMFAAMLDSGLNRRRTIKTHLGVLECEVQSANKAASSPARTKSDSPTEVSPSTLEHLFYLLQSCRREPASREGRYELWRSYNRALAEGFRYSEEILATDTVTSKLRTAHSALRQWFDLTWSKFESLKARDIDHVERINNISDVLYNIVHLRNSRVQLDIARASQRDSEDMKFITLLGAIFLPASLVASILNVQEFQFLPGGKLFGVYIAITIPLAGLLVTSLLARPLWKRWRGARRHQGFST